jgi:exonuclease III
VDNPLHLAFWNANGLTQHAEKLRTFIYYHNTDAMLISETHFTEKSYFKLPYYSVYHINHPVGTARGGSAIIIKKLSSMTSTTTTALTTYKLLRYQWKTPLDH